MSQSVGLAIVIADLAVLAEAAASLVIRKLNERRLKDSKGQTHEVDHVLQDQEGRKLGVKIREDGTVDLVAEKCGDAKTEALAKKLTQKYARIKTVNELKQKGYQVVKEEVQPDQSIRVVVQKWQ